MHLHFKDIRMKNFLVTGDSWTTINLDKNDFTVIVGKNGVGKSTMIDALCYVLFNKPFRKVNLGLLINTFNNKNSLVEVRFDVGGAEYVVRRGQKPKVFEIYKDKNLVEVDPSVGDYQDYLENQVLHVNFQTFTQINILGKANWKPFMQLEAKNRRAVVEELLDSQIYSVMADLLKEDIKFNKTEIKDAESELRIATSALDTAKNLLEQFDKSQVGSLDSFKDAILKAKANVEELEGEVLILKENYEATVADVPSLPPKDKLEKMKSTLDSEIQAGKAEIRRNLSIISKVDELTTCPTCFQVVDKNHKHDIVGESRKVITQLETTLEGLNEKLEKVTDALYEHESYEINVVAARVNVTNTEREVTYANKTLNNHIDVLKLQVEQQKRTKPDVGLDTKEEAYEAQKRLYDDLNTVLGHNTSVLKKYLGDDGLKSILIKQYIPTINEKMNEYLEAMDLFAQFEINEEFEETIKSHYRDTFTYYSFSEGQKLRIDLALLLTWRNIAMQRNTTSTNILIMDEILDSSLDDDGTADFMAILRGMGLAQNVFIISHKASTVDSFEHSIKVSMDGNFAQYDAD